MTADDGAADIRVLVADSQGLAPGLLERLPGLALVAVIGAGYEKIDRVALHRRGIALTNTPGANSADVADLVLGLALALVRGVVANDARVRSGAVGREGMGRPARSMRSLAVGIVGLGAIGSAAAARFAALGCRIAWWGPNEKPGEPLPRTPSLLALARDSDLLIVSAPGNRPLVDAAVIAALGPAGYLVNVGRGGLVDEDALIAALRQQRLAGAALDVFVSEPPAPERWNSVPNLLLSPHVGGYADGAMNAMIALLRANITAALAGEQPPNLVAPPTETLAE